VPETDCACDAKARAPHFRSRGLYGGKELALILPLTNLSDAKRLAEELRNQVEALHLPHQTSETKPFVTVSVGVAAMVPKCNSDPLSLINLADQALYKAKRAGKNGVRSSRLLARQGKKRN